jgi:hypothetical protein
MVSGDDYMTNAKFACKFILVAIASLLLAVAETASGADGNAGSTKINPADYIAAIAALIGAIGLVLVVKQLRAIHTQNRIAALQASYDSIFLMNQYMVENPALMLKYVGSRRYELLRGKDEAALLAVAEWDLLLDHYEFRFLSVRETNTTHAFSLLKSQMSNPELRSFWVSGLRGHFNLEFELAVDQVLKELNASDAEAQDQDARFTD